MIVSSGRFGRPGSSGMDSLLVEVGGFGIRSTDVVVVTVAVGMVGEMAK